MKIHMLALYRVKEDKVEEVKEAVRVVVDAIKENEPGTLFYEAYQGKEDVSFFHLMTFDDEQAEDAHRSTPHMAEFAKVLYPNCVEEPVFVELDLIRSNVR